MRSRPLPGAWPAGPPAAGRYHIQPASKQPRAHISPLCGLIDIIKFYQWLMFNA
jgi:hypothetical protein